MEKKKSLKLLVLFLPAIIIFSLTIISVFNIFIDGKGLMIISLLFIFPIVFIFQGALTRYYKYNLIISILISTVAILAIIFIFLNSSALVYFFLYFILWFLAYGAVAFYKKK